MDGWVSGKEKLHKREKGGGQESFGYTTLHIILLTYHEQGKCVGKHQTEMKETTLFSSL